MTRTYLKQFNLHKTNTANEELVISLLDGREVQERKPIYRLLHHYSSLSNKMGNSLLAVRDINHKYIVVGKKENYSYDAVGVRRSKTASEGEEKKEILFISDTSGELSRTLAETDEEGELLASYGWGDTLLSQTREGKTSTYLYDGQGNVRGLLDEKGNLTDTYAYNAYGELTEKTGGGCKKSCVYRS